jgi:hypothetical protein
MCTGTVEGAPRSTRARVSPFLEISPGRNFEATKPSASRLLPGGQSPRLSSCINRYRTFSAQALVELKWGPVEGIVEPAVAK